jgi:hypothetical protein
VILETLFISSWVKGKIPLIATLPRLAETDHLYFKFDSHSDTSAAKHDQQSIVIVPANHPGVTLVRPLSVVRQDSALRERPIKLTIPFDRI